MVAGGNAPFDGWLSGCFLQDDCILDGYSGEFLNYFLKMVLLLYLYACLFISIGINPVLCVVMASIGALVLYPTRSGIPIDCHLWSSSTEYRLWSTNTSVMRALT